MTSMPRARRPGRSGPRRSSRLIGQLAIAESGVELDEVRVVRLPDGKDPDEVVREAPGSLARGGPDGPADRGVPDRPAQQGPRPALAGWQGAIRGRDRAHPPGDPEPGHARRLPPDDPPPVRRRGADGPRGPPPARRCDRRPGPDHCRRRHRGGRCAAGRPDPGRDHARRGGAPPADPPRAGPAAPGRRRDRPRPAAVDPGPRAVPGDRPAARLGRPGRSIRRSRCPA